MGRSKRLNVVRKSGKAQAKEQLIDSSNEINQNKPNVYEKCAQFGGMKFLYVQFLSSFVFKFHTFLF